MSIDVCSLDSRRSTNKVINVNVCRVGNTGNGCTFVSNVSGMNRPIVILFEISKSLSACLYRPVGSSILLNMETLKCTKCGEEAYTNEEFVSGKCRWCSGELEEEKGDESTERDMGYYYDDF